MLRWTNRRGTVAGLILIIATSAILSYYRVFAIPILLCPDEDSHLDYAFSIYSAGHLLNVRNPPSSGWNVEHRPRRWRWERISHLYTLHLTDTGRMIELLADTERVPADYGTKEYFDRIDKSAPQGSVKTEGLTPLDNPALMSGYPFGYYALVAAEMRAVHAVSGSLVYTFFSARLLSVGLLIVSLVLTYGVLRQLHSRYALAITAIVGIHPLTTYVSSCIQPDNLSLTLVLLSWYLGLRAYKLPTRPILFLLSLSLGALFVTKYHHYFFTAVPLLVLLIVRHRLPLKTIVAVLLPSVGLISIQVWLGWGASIIDEQMARQWDGAVQRIPATLVEYYGGGYAYSSYWSTYYGWPGVPTPVKVLLQAGTVVVFLAVVMGLARRARFLVTVATRRGARRATTLGLDPLVTSHLLYLGFMMSLLAVVPSFYAQGRHFFPFIVSGLYIAVTFAPMAIARGRLRRRVSWSLIVVLLIACIAAQYHAVIALNPRYYPGSRTAYVPLIVGPDDQHAANPPAR